MKIRDVIDAMTKPSNNPTDAEFDIIRTRKIGIVFETKDNKHHVLYSGDVSQLPDKYLDAEVDSLGAGNWNYRIGIIVGVKDYE